MYNILIRIIAIFFVIVSIKPIISGDNNRSGKVDVTALVITPYNPQILYAVINNNSLYKSIDSGKNWTYCDNEGFDYISTIYIDSKTNYVYVGTLYEIYISKDGGANWVNFLEDKKWGAWKIIIQQTTQPRIYISSALGCFTRNMLEDKWKKIEAPAEHVSVTPVAVDPIEPINIYMRMGRAQDVVLNDNWNGDGLYKSSDYGHSWEYLSIKSNNLIISTTNNNLMYSAYGKKILKSIDGGASWNEKEINILESNIEELGMNPIDENVLYATTSSYYSYGTFSGTPVFSISRIFKSIDGGETWRRISNFPVNNIVIDPSNPNILYAGTPGWGIFKSTNAGKTWKKINKGIKLPKNMKN